MIASESTPVHIFDTLLYSNLRADALKAAIDLKLFTAIADGARDPEQIAAKCGGSQRAIRALCNFLVVNGFLTGNDGSYDLTPDVQLFLNEHSPAYLGSIATFMGSRRSSFGELYN